MPEEYPWFRFWVGDYLTDVRVQTMPLMAQGAYLRLLCFQWVEGSLPGCEDDLYRLCQCDPDELDAFSLLKGEELTAGGLFFEICWPHLDDRFPLGADGRRRNPRLERERCNHEQLSKAGQKGGRASAEKRRRKRDRTIVQRSANESPSILESDVDVDEERRREPPKPPRGGITAGELMKRWNSLAGMHGLRPIQRVSETRLKHARNRIAECGGFWLLLDDRITRRTDWFRANKQPTLDQVIRLGYFQSNIVEEGMCEPKDEAPEETASDGLTPEERRAYLQRYPNSGISSGVVLEADAQVRCPDAGARSGAPRRPDPAGPAAAPGNGTEATPRTEGETAGV